MNDFNHHGWLDLPGRQGRMRDATPAEVAGECDLIGDMQRRAEHDRKLDEMWGRTKLVLMIFVLGVAFIAGIITAARGADNGQIPPDVPDHIRSWFKGVRSPHGVICCDIADGHRTTWEKRPGDQRYWVPIAGKWHPVPPEAVVLNAGNPVGEAVVWYVLQGVNTYYIRCFVPGGGV